MFVVVSPPGIQLYVVPPEALRVAFCPLQIVVLPLAVIVGSELTVTVEEVEVLQPLKFVPTTVYVAFTVGETEILAVVCPTGIQLYVEAPDTVRVVV